MGDHDTPSGFLGHVASLNGLSHGTNLVNLEQEGIAQLLVDSCLDSLRVGNKEIVSNNLNTITKSLSHLNVGAEVVLVEWIFNRLDWVAGRQVVVDVQESVWAHHSVVLSCLHGKIVGVCLGVVELRGGDVEANVNLTSVSTVLDRLHDDLEGLVLISYLWGSEATLITNVGGTLSELLLQESGE